MCYFLDRAGGEVPCVEVAAATGEVDFGAGGLGGEGGGCEGRVRDVEACEEGVWGRGVW